jgi:peptidyl-prolyl cis-trans isomerase C
MNEFSVTALTRLSAAAAITVLLAACNTQKQPAAPAAPDKPTVATVDGKTISQAEYDFYVKQLTAGKGPVQLTPEQKTQVLDELVSMQLMAAQGAKDGVDSDPEVAARLEITRMHLLAEAESQKYLKNKQPTDQELHAEYDSAIAALDKTEYHARHILVASKELAEQLTKKIKGGAKFEDVAKAQSIDTGSKVNGGDLGWFTLARMVKPFSEAVKGLKKGEMTPAPVQTQFGWHIIKLDDTRDVAPPPFEQVKDQIVNRIIQKKLQTYAEELKKGAKIEIREIKDTAKQATEPAPSAAQPPAEQKTP